MIVYIAKTGFEELSGKVKKGEEVTKEAIMNITEATNCSDEDIMIPIDMGETEFEDFEDMIEKIGTKKTVEAFTEARERLKKKEGELPEEERPEEMTVAEWRQALAEQDLEGEEEELLDEGEEEELLDSEPEEEVE